MLGTETVNNKVDVKLTYGYIEGTYYSQTPPDEIFDTEDEAIEYAHKKDKRGRWLIIPVVFFDNL